MHPPQPTARRAGPWRATELLAPAKLSRAAILAVGLAALDAAEPPLALRHAFDASGHERPDRRSTEGRHEPRVARGGSSSTLVEKQTRGLFPMVA